MAAKRECLLCSAVGENVPLHPHGWFCCEHTALWLASPEFTHCSLFLSQFVREQTKIDAQTKKGEAK